MEKVNIELEDLENFSAQHGQKNLNSVLSTLGKGTIFIEALETEVGKALLSEAVNRLTELHERLIDDPFCDKKLRMEFFILRGICRRWSAKVMKFHKAVKLLKP